MYFYKQNQMPETYSITESLPVEPHVYKFLVKRVGSNIYVATRKESLGNIIISSLGNNADVKHTKIPNKFTKLFHVIIKDHIYLRNSVSLGVMRGQIFNNTIDLLFREELFHYMVINTSHEKGSYLESMRNFLSCHDITEDDIKYETLYREFNRKKSKINNNIHT